MIKKKTSLGSWTKPKGIVSGLGLLDFIIVMLLVLSFSIIVYAATATGKSTNWTPYGGDTDRHLIVKVETTATNNSNGATFSVTAKGYYGIYKNNLTCSNTSGDLFYKVGSKLSYINTTTYTTAHSKAAKESGTSAATESKHNSSTAKKSYVRSGDGAGATATYSTNTSRTMTVPKEHTAKTVYVYAHMHKPKTTHTPVRNAYAVTNASMSAHTMYTVTYNANTVDTDGNALSGTPANIPAAQINCISGVTCATSCDKIQCNASDVQYASPALDGYTFTGWNTSADGTGTAYAPSATAPNSNLTLYAQWKKNPEVTHKYIITYNFNGGTGWDDSDTASTFTEEEVTGISGYKLLSPGKIKARPEGTYSAGMWNTKADGSGVTLSEGTDIGDVVEKIGIADKDSDITLYAMWEDDSNFTVYNPKQTPPDSPGDKVIYKFRKVDAETGEALAGAKFSVETFDSSKDAAYTTDENGEFTIEADSWLSYLYITEVTAPNGYKAWTGRKFIALAMSSYAPTLDEDELSYSSGKTLGNFDETKDEAIGYDKLSKTKDSNGNTVDTYTIYLRDNKEAKDLVISKIDKDSSVILPGAKFTLTGNSGNATGYIKEETVGADGKAYFKDLPYGIYTLEETGVPSGYKIPGTTYTVTVNDDGVQIE